MGARLNKADANLVVAAFITNAAVLEEVKDENNKQVSNKVDGSTITWEAFRDTIRQWIEAFG